MSEWQAWELAWRECVKCPIGVLAHRHVLGVGPHTARLLLIGEGPGKSEDVLGIPFIGRAGKLLDRMLVESKIFRSSVYITNLVACRPCDGSASPNRPPSVDEITNCRPRLTHLLSLLHPHGVVLIGRPAQVHGLAMLQAAKWNGPILYLTHPAAFLRQGGPKAPGYGKAVTDLAAFWITLGGVHEQNQ